MPVQLNLLIQSIRSKRWFSTRLSVQLLSFVGVTVAIAAMIVGSIFTFDSVEHGRQQVNQQIIFLGKNIAATSGMLIITNDLPFLDDVLSLNAEFPMVSSVLAVDEKGNMLSEVVKIDGKVKVNTQQGSVLPRAYGAPFYADTGKPAHPDFLNQFIPEESLLEIWHPVVAGHLIGSVRVQYSLKALRATILKQWWRTLWYAGATVMGVLTLLTLMLRSPMRALIQTTEFSRRLGSEMGSSIPVYNGTLEISALTVALNALSLQLNAQDNALADRIAQNQSILDNVVDGILTIDAAGKIRSFNKAATDIFGYELDEIIGQSVNVLMSGTDSSYHDSFMQTYADTCFAKVAGIGRETEAVHKDGTIFPIDLAISTASDKGDAVFIGIVRDITERRRLDQLKSEFVSTVSHELRTPLTSIHGSLKLLEGGIAGALSPAATQLISVAQKSSQRLILLINDLLDMEKLAAGKMTMNLAQVDLIDIVKQSIQDNFGYASTHHVIYVLGTHTEQVKVSADPGRLAQVLANLLSNAAKFSGGAPQVDIEVSVHGAFSKVKVIDHGAGIPDDFRSEIFGAFAQANNGNTRKQGGTGLGLKISKGLVHAMKGEIGFESQWGTGTCFWFTLPLMSDADSHL